MADAAVPDTGAIRSASHLEALLRKLTLFLVLNFALTQAFLLGVMGVPQRQTPLQSISWFFTGRQGQDSWRPMSRAHAFLVPAKQRSRTLYQKHFYSPAVRHKGFQYPPTALLVVHALKAVAGDAWYQTLLAINWAFVPLTAAATVGVFSRALALAGLVPAGGLRRREWIWISGVGLLATVTFYPAIVAYRAGQISACLNGLFAIALWLWLSQKRAAAGLCVAAMAIVKPQHAFLGAWGLLRGAWRFSAAVAVASLLALGASIVLFGFEPHGEYPGVISFLGRRGESFFPNQSANGLLNRLLSNGENVKWMEHFVPYHPVVYAGTLATSAVILGLALFYRKPHGTRGSAVDFAAAALAGTMASPIAWEHHYGLLLPVFALLLPLVWSRSWFGAAGLPLLALLYFIASNCFHVTTRLADSWANVLQSYLYAAALGVFAFLITGRARGDGTARGDT